MANNAVSGGLPTTLYANMADSSTSTSLEVPSGAPVSTWPTVYPFTVLLDYGDSSFEAVAVTGPYTGSGPYTYPCIRAIDGTELNAHSAGASVVPGVTRQDYGSPSAGGQPSPSNVAWLVTDDTGQYPVIREGTGGPAFRTTGYNIYVNYPPEGSSQTTQETEALFARLRPRSLIRTVAYAPNPADTTWATALASLATTVAAGKKYGHRFVFIVSTWADGNELYNDGGTKTSAWVTSPSTGYNSTGTNNFKSWLTGLVTQFAAESSVAIYDLMNEPVDNGTNYEAWATYCSTVSGWIKAIAPGALCYLGAYDISGIAATNEEYSTIVASLDLVNEHDYAQYGFSQLDDGVGPMSVVTTKPGFCDEYGFWAKGHYGTYSDPDLDPAFGLPAMTYEAQARMVEQYLESVFANPGIFAAMYWSLQDIDANNSPYPEAAPYIGGGQYEPVNQSRTHDVIKFLGIPEPWFTLNTITGLQSWVTSAQCLRYPDGATISSSQSSALQQYIFDKYQRAQLPCPATGNAPVARHRTVTIRGRDWPSYEFSGTAYFEPGYNWEDAGSGAFWFVIYPTALPSSGNYAYLLSPSTNTTASAVRFTSSGTVELTKYDNVTSDTVVATTSAAVSANVPALVMVTYTSGASYRVDVNTANYPTGSSPTSGSATLYGTTATTFTESAKWFGAAATGSSGFVGQLLEALFSPILATEAQIATVNAYLTRKYGLQF